MLELGWRKFVGREYVFPKPHRVDLPVLMDATVEQVEGLRFLYCLPLSETRLLVEDTYVADRPDLDRGAIGERIEAYLRLRGWVNGELEREESAVLPIALSDDVHAFWRGGGARVAKLGLRGGFFHPSTGYSLADAVRTAHILAEQRDFDGAALHHLFEAEAIQLWRKREVYRSFNAALLDAPVWERRKIMENFYHLEGELIARFHAGKLGMMDRMRMSGIKLAKTSR
jgi:lycopene beta-cyclase